MAPGCGARLRLVATGWWRQACGGFGCGRFVGNYWLSSCVDVARHLRAIQTLLQPILFCYIRDHIVHTMLRSSYYNNTAAAVLSKSYYVIILRPADPRVIAQQLLL